MKLCDYGPCDNQTKTPGTALCVGHYGQRRRGEQLRPLRSQVSIVERFWSNVTKRENGCWIFGITNGKGYGKFDVGNNKKVPAHRFSWELAGNSVPEPGWYDPIENPDGWQIDHDKDGVGCRNKACVNPSHLVIAKPSENRGRKKLSNTTGYNGVVLDRRNGSFAARKTIDGICHSFGYHATALEAATFRAQKLTELGIWEDGFEELINPNGKGE